MDGTGGDMDQGLIRYMLRRLTEFVGQMVGIAIGVVVLSFGLLWLLRNGYQWLRAFAP